MKCRQNRILHYGGLFVIRKLVYLFMFVLFSVTPFSCREGETTGPEEQFPDLEQLDTALMRKLQATGLDVVWIETEDHEEPTYEIADAPEGCWGGSIKNATKVPGHVVVQSRERIIYNSGLYDEKQSGMKVKIRGNWSARRPKKPYKIKLQKKADLLGRDDDYNFDKNWLLLPVFDLNYMIGLKVNDLMGLQWTPVFHFVNVVFNSDYKGLYMLMESVERNADCRLNVDKQTGYIIELDAYWWKEKVYAKASFEEPMNYTFKYPDEDDISSESLDYIQRVVSIAEESTRDGSYEKYIDVDSFARWMLAHDILGNIDGAGSNIFLTKFDSTDGSLLKMGCLWDFDVILKSKTWDEIHGRYFFDGLFSSENRTFVNRYKVLWNQKRYEVFIPINTYLQNYLRSDLRKSVDISIDLNNERWKEEMGAIPHSEDFIMEALTYLNQRKDWLTNAVDSI